MSRPVNPDYEVNREELIQLFLAAKGNRSRDQFAREANISVSMVSAVIHNRFDKPPVPSTLKKIADSTDKVSYEDLLRAAGYDPERFIPKKELEESRNTMIASFGQIAASKVMTYLRELPEQYMCGMDMFWDLVAQDSNGKKWFFDFLLLGRDTSTFAFKDSIINHLGSIILLAGDKDGKYTIVTDSQKVLDFLSEHKPIPVSVTVSVMLIDMSLTSVGINKEVVITE